MIWLFVFLGIFIWLVLGFIAFLIEAKFECYPYFNSEARKEFMNCLGFGPLAFIIMLCTVLFDWFCNTFMNDVLFNLNARKEAKKKHKKSEE